MRQINSDFFRVLFLALILTASPPALAQPENGWEMTMVGKALNFDYQEFDDTGKLLDKEFGVIPGVGISLSHTQERWLLAGDFSYHMGDVTYDGQTNDGIQLSTITNQRIADISFRAESWQKRSFGRDYALYLGAGYHLWERDIQATISPSGTPISGLFETYEWWYGFLGAKAVLHTNELVSWLLDVRITRPINPSITVNFNGQHDNIKLSLGERWAKRLSLPFRYASSPSTHITAEPYMETRELGRSATTPLTNGGVTTGTVYEPRSESRNFGLMIGINHHF